MDDHTPHSDKCREMVQRAGFQDGVNRRLRVWADKWPLMPHEMRSIDDLYEIYGNHQVME